MMRAKTRTKDNTLSDAAWLEGFLRQAKAPVRSSEALVPLAPVTAAKIVRKPQAKILTSPELRVKAEQIMSLAQVEDMPVFPVAIAPLFAGWRLHTRSSRYDYIFCNLAEDPLFSDPDGFPIPTPVLRHLRRLSRTSLAKRFDLLYVVHEVKKGSIAKGDLLTADKLVPPSPRVQQASRRFGSLGTVLWLGASIPLMAGAGLGAAPLAGITLLIDPLLLGVVSTPGKPVCAGEMAVWFYLAHWRYTAD